MTSLTRRPGRTANPGLGFCLCAVHSSVQLTAAHSSVPVPVLSGPSSVPVPVLSGPSLTEQLCTSHSSVQLTAELYRSRRSPYSLQSAVSTRAERQSQRLLHRLPSHPGSVLFTVPDHSSLASARISLHIPGWGMFIISTLPSTSSSASAERISQPSRLVESAGLRPLRRIRHMPVNHERVPSLAWLGGPCDPLCQVSRRHFNPVSTSRGDMPGRWEADRPDSPSLHRWRRLRGQVRSADWPETGPVLPTAAAGC